MIAAHCSALSSGESFGRPAGVWSEWVRQLGTVVFVWFEPAVGGPCSRVFGIFGSLGPPAAVPLDSDGSLYQSM